MNPNESILIKNLNKTFHVQRKGGSLFNKIKSIVKPNRTKVNALKNINLSVKKGESIGIIGSNGSGKTTLLKIIIGAIEPDKNSIVETNGKIIRLALGMGFDPNLTAKDNIFLNGTILGLHFKKIGEIFHEIIGFAELEDFIDTPIKFFSSGMKSRLSFAIALHAEADIFLIDEFFGDVGDEAFKEKSQKAFEENILEGKTILHVSHSMSTIQNHCDRIVILEKGEATVYEDIDEAIAIYTKTK